MKKYGAVNKGKMIWVVKYVLNPIFKKGAHVVGHYADGAKVIGLTDAELYKQLKLFNYVSDTESNTSPYARNHHSELLRQIERDLKRKEPVKPFGLGGPRHSVSKGGKKQTRQRITLKVIGLERMTNAGGPAQYPRITLNDGVRERAASLAQKDRFQLPANFTKMPPIHR